MKKEQQKVENTVQTANEIWDALGELREEDAIQVVSRLFLVYEEIRKREPENEASLLFFKNLENVLSQVRECNVNRR